MLVLKKFNQHIVLAAPLTSRPKQNPYYFPFAHEGVQFAIILSQVRLLSTNRFTRRIRKIGRTLFQNIQDQVIEKAIKTNEPRG